MTKRISLLVTIFILSLTSVFSQVDFGINVAMGASRLRINNPESFPDLFESNTNAFAMNFGPSLTVGLRDKWSLHFGLDFSFNPSNLLFNGDTTYSVNSSFLPVEQKYQSLFLEIPVLARYHFVSRDRMVSPYIAFGAVYDHQILESCPEGLECLNHTKDFNLGTIIGAGFEVWRLDISAKAEFGLLNTITEDYNISKSDLSINKDLLLIEVGYTFE